LFLIRDGQILLLRRYNTGYEDGKYSVPAGHLDGGAEVVEAAIREALEEIGVEIGRDDVRVVGVMHRQAGLEERIDFFVKVCRWKGEITNREPEKCDELRWVPVNELPQNVIPYVRQAICNYLEGIWFDSYGWTASKKHQSVHSK
jgi:8-oxo-dGTP pyrophosphatase MutT (NUDIX family)